MKKYAVIFSGQGTQTLNMGLDFYNEFNSYKETIDLATTNLPTLKDVVYGENQDKLNETIYAQFAICSMQVGIFDLVKNKVQVESVAGFSLGEYTALYASNVLTKTDLFKTIEYRATSMTDANVDGAMIACLRTDYATVSKLLDELAENEIYGYIANYNTDEQIVVSALNCYIEQIVEYFKENGIKKAIALAVAGPFHSKYYKEAATEFTNKLVDINIEKPTLNLYLNTTGQLYNDENIIDVCRQQMYSQVNWCPLIKAMIDDGVTDFIEIGYGNVLSGFMKKIDKSVNIISVSSIDDLKKLEDL